MIIFYLIVITVVILLLLPYLFPFKEDFTRYKQDDIVTDIDYSHWKTNNSLLEKYQLYFYKELLNYLGKRKVYVFSKVHISDLVKPQSKLSYTEFMRTYNKLNQEQVDYVITDYHGKILCILDIRDDRKNDIQDKIFHASFCESVGIPFLQFKKFEPADFLGLEKYL